MPKGNEALIITGAGSKGDNRPRADAENAPVVENTMNFKVVTSGGSIVLPGIQRAQRLSLESRTVDLGEDGHGLHCVSSQAIPVEVEAVMAFKVGNDRASIANAVTRFQETSDDTIKQTIKDIAHGHLRTIVGGLTVEQLISERNALTDEVRDATAVAMQKLGLVIDSFQVKDIRDPADAAEVRKAAASAETERAQAEAAQAGPLAAAKARQAVVEADTRAAELEAQLEEQRLQTTVRKPADARAYEQVTNANAEREASIAAAQAEAERTRLEAEAKAGATRVDAAARSEAVTKMGTAEANATKARLLAEADGTREKGLAEAAGIEARQEALSENAEGVIAQQIAEQLPAIVAAAAQQYNNVGNLTVLDGAEGLNRGLLSTVGIASAIMPLAKGLFDATKDVAAHAAEPDARPKAASGDGLPRGPGE